MTSESGNEMSEIDRLFTALDELKREHEKMKEQTLKNIGTLEFVGKTVKTDFEKFVVNLATSFVSERETRISEDLTLFGIVLSLIRQQAREINELKCLVASSASYEKLAEDVKKSLKEGLKEEYGQAFEFLEDLKQRIAKQEQETQQRIRDYSK